MYIHFLNPYKKYHAIFLMEYLFFEKFFFCILECTKNHLHWLYLAETRGENDVKVLGKRLDKACCVLLLALVFFSVPTF